jgi:hypothetical protein
LEFNILVFKLAGGGRHQLPTDQVYRSEIRCDFGEACQKGKFAEIELSV